MHDGVHWLNDTSYSKSVCFVSTGCLVDRCAITIHTRSVAVAVIADRTAYDVQYSQQPEMAAEPGNIHLKL